MTSIRVSNIAADVDEKKLRDFFSFCGKISNLQIKDAGGQPDAKEATITFERQGAAKTALLLQDAQLGSNKIKVESETTSSSSTAEADDEKGDVEQEDKPKTRIMAEYLSHGYAMGDKALKASIDFDKQHGLSSRFSNFLSSIDSKLGVTKTSTELDNKYKVSEKVTETSQDVYHQAQSYLDRALDTKTGQKVRAFYNAQEKSALDIHNEARRLADLRSGKEENVGDTTTTSTTTAADPVATTAATGAAPKSDTLKSD